MNEDSLVIEYPEVKKQRHEKRYRARDSDKPTPALLPFAQLQGSVSCKAGWSSIPAVNPEYISQEGSNCSHNSRSNRLGVLAINLWEAPWLDPVVVEL